MWEGGGGSQNNSVTHVAVYIYIYIYACMRACVIWVREEDTPHLHRRKAFHLQLVSEPTHSYQGGISGNVLPFAHLCRPASYSSNSDVPETRKFHHVRVQYHSKINYNLYFDNFVGFVNFIHHKPPRTASIFLTRHLGLLTRHHGRCHATSVI